MLGVEEGCAYVADQPGVAAIWVLPPAGEEDALRAVVGGPAADRIEVAAGVEVRRCTEILR